MGKRKERPASSSTSTACTSARRDDDDDDDAINEARRQRDDDGDCEQTVAPAAAATDPAGLPANEVGGETRPETGTGIRKKRRKDKKRKTKKRKRTEDGHKAVLGAPCGWQSSPDKQGTENAADEGGEREQSSDHTAKVSGTFDRSAPGDYRMRIERWKNWGFRGREWGHKEAGCIEADPIRNPLMDAFGWIGQRTVRERFRRWGRSPKRAGCGLTAGLGWGWRSARQTLKAQNRPDGYVCRARQHRTRSFLLPRSYAWGSMSRMMESGCDVCMYAQPEMFSICFRTNCILMKQPQDR